MRVLFYVWRREFLSYFATPLAAIFLVIFLVAAGALTFFLGDFLGGGQADLSAFFGFHPWLFLVLMPAIGMRLWAEERSTGTIEFLMTLPVAPWQAVLGKFLAAWSFAGLALALTFPIWITVNYLGHPDNGVILLSYLGSFLMGGAFLALTCCFSALTSSQVSAFVIGIAVGCLFMLSSLDSLLNALSSWLPPFVGDLLSTFSFARHFDAITRGILDLRDIFFFVAFIALMLYLNTLILVGRNSRSPMSATPRGRWTPAMLSTVSAVCAIVLFLGSIYLSSNLLTGARLDLTERHLFTIGDSTRKVLAGIDEPITVKLFETPQLVSAVPVLDVHARQVNELLATLQDLAGPDRLHVETIEVEPFSAQEDQALAYGLQGFALGDADERGYFGIVGTNSIDGLEAIDFVDPSRGALLQYDVTRLIYRLSHPDEPKVRVIDHLQMFGSVPDGRRPWAVLDMVGANFELDPIEGDATTIPPDTDVLMLAHPVRLPPALQYAVDQYALSGGTVLAFVDPLAERSTPNPQNPAEPLEPTSDLGPLLQSWGVSMDPDSVVGDRDMAIQTVGTAGNQRVVAPYLPWLKIDRNALNSEDVVTEQLSLMRMSSAGAIEPLPGATTTVTPLIQTTENSMLLSQAQVMSRTDPNTLLASFAPSGRRFDLAAHISGPARTAFPDGPPEGAATTDPQRRDGTVNVILVADTDMLTDSHVVDETNRPVSNNSDFVLNAIETLAGGDELAGARGGGIAYRPFTTIDTIQRAAEQQYQSAEQSLSQELSDIQQKLADLQPGGGQDQQQLVADSNARMLDLRQQLRQVRAALRSDIDALETRLELINIALVPLLVIVGALALTLWRRLRLSRDRRRLAMGSAT